MASKLVIRGSEATEDSLHKFKSSVIFDLVKERSLPFVKGLLSILFYWKSEQLKLRGSDLKNIKCQKEKRVEPRIRDWQIKCFR